LSTLPDMLENVFGRILHGWSRDPEGRAMPFQVVEFAHPSGERTFATLGLSRVELCRSSCDCVQREELFIRVRPESLMAIPAILQDLGLETIRRGLGHSHGQIIGPRGPLAEGSQCTALMCLVNDVGSTNPLVVTPDEGCPITLCRVLPITDAEIALVRDHGMAKFDAVLRTTPVDLTDLSRPSCD